MTGENKKKTKEIQKIFGSEHDSKISYFSLKKISCSKARGYSKLTLRKTKLFEERVAKRIRS